MGVPNLIFNGLRQEEERKREGNRKRNRNKENGHKPVLIFSQNVYNLSITYKKCSGSGRRHPGASGKINRVPLPFQKESNPSVWKTQIMPNEPQNGLDVQRRRNLCKTMTNSYPSQTENNML